MEQRLEIGKRDLINFRLKLQDKVLEYLYKTVLKSHVHPVQYVNRVCTSMQYLQPSVV